MQYLLTQEEFDSLISLEIYRALDRRNTRLETGMFALLDEIATLPEEPKKRLWKVYKEALAEFDRENSQGDEK